MKYKDYLITAISYLKQPGKRRLIQAAYRLKSQIGLEIGGPSIFFGLKGGFPVYLFAKKIDGVNFSNETVWEGSIKEGETYRYFKNKIGHQYIAEATDLSMVPDQSYDFLLSCHSLEHVANPIKAVKEWNRVLKTGGALVLVLPDKRFTFDIKRPYTDMQHLITDFHAGTDEYDTTHFEEIISHHDVTKDPGLKPSDEIRELLKNNFTNRLAHHHVYSHELIKQLLDYCGFDTNLQHEAPPFHLIAVAQKR
jgi:SAM-dependent methyltransferase